MEICPECELKFNNTKALGSHMYYVHGKRRGEAVAKMSAALEQEKRTSVEMSLQCSFCETQWKEYFSLPMNISVFVKKGESIACPRCAGTNIYFTVPKEGE